MIFTAYPSIRDFHEDFKVMMKRTKMLKEINSRYSYYLSNRSKITGSEAVSCIIDGIENTKTLSLKWELKRASIPWLNCNILISARWRKLEESRYEQ